MGNPEVGPEPFEATHSPELLEDDACLVNVIRIAGNGGIGSYGPVNTAIENATVSERQTDGGTVAELRCSVGGCGVGCFVLHERGRIQNVADHPGTQVEPPENCRKAPVVEWHPEDLPQNPA